jgi:hypothetical protein
LSTRQFLHILKSESSNLLEHMLCLNHAHRFLA